MPLSRRAFLALSGVLPNLHGWAPTSLVLRRDDGVLRVSAPSLHFLEGKTLRRLQDGAGLVFSLQLSISTDQFRTVERRQVERFVVSFDLWEEKFAITRLGLVKQQASHLTKDAAERWLFEHSGVSLFGMQPTTPHWVRAELRADDQKDLTGFLLDPSVTLTRLVEWFGRAQRGDAQRWALDHGPFRLEELQQQ